MLLANMQSPFDRPDPMNLCPIVGSIQQIGNEWRLVVIRYLMDRPMRFNELLKTGIDSKTLSRVLKYLQDQEIVRRDVVSTQPFSVQYTLTPKGVELEPMIESLRSWGKKWIVHRGEDTHAKPSLSEDSKIGNGKTRAVMPR